MPIAANLQRFYLPEWERPAPVEWERRLREISPITDKLSHLRFRAFTPEAHLQDERSSDGWATPDRIYWLLYSCTPMRMVRPDEHAKYAKHWSELPKTEQQGRKATVSNYQHFMWHSAGVEVKPFWILQGSHGGTPAAYTRRETLLMEAEGMDAEPFPLGILPACPFDERAVKQVEARDRFYQAGKNLDALVRENRTDVQKAQDEAADKDHRRKLVQWMRDTTLPQAEFLKSYLRTKEADNTLRKATRYEADCTAMWADSFIEFGSVPNARVPQSRALQVAVL